MKLGDIFGATSLGPVESSPIFSDTFFEYQIFTLVWPLNFSAWVTRPERSKGAKSRGLKGLQLDFFYHTLGWLGELL